MEQKLKFFSLLEWIKIWTQGKWNVADEDCKDERLFCNKIRIQIPTYSLSSIEEEDKANGQIELFGNFQDG